MPKTTQVLLARGDLASHVSLSVDQTLRQRSRNDLVASTPTSASAVRYPELISAATRLLTNSVLELARLDAAEKRG
jgi:hypothetical protein